MGDDFNPEFIDGKSSTEVTPENLANANKWAEVMSDEPFAGESTPTETAAEEAQPSSEYDEGISGAAKLAVALDGISREIGVGVTIEGIKDFDASRSNNILMDLNEHFGIDTATEKKNVEEEIAANKANEIDFYTTENAPVSINKSNEEMIKSLTDFKELITEVEGADPAYEYLREGAKNEGKNVWDYAVQQYGVRSLTVLFRTLSEEKKAHDKQPEGIEDEEHLDGIVDNNVSNDITETESPENEEQSKDTEDNANIADGESEENVTLNPEIISIDHN